ncbi:Lrp/AsnC family transcriptional regulator [Candidatus Woesearchaeota archaeon]|nr:Lrp/AsnC family transcriptional regulator [Candidatus Woesearchaeota archaeon]
MRVLAQQKKAILLDKKDWRILQEAVQNVRQPLSRIAQQCQLSRQSVEYRLQQMEKNQLLIGSRAVVNIRALGYSSYHVFLEVRTPEQEKELIKRALAAPFVNALLVYSGKFNLEISLMVKSNEEFLEYYHQLMEGIRVRDELILVLLQTLRNEVLPQRYFPFRKEKGKEENISLLTGKTSGIISGKISAKTVAKTSGKRVKVYLPDETDFKLLFLLSRDARRASNAAKIRTASFLGAVSSGS